MANKEVNLGGYLVSEDSEPYLIAEIGINHNGDLQIAKKLIDASFATEWNCVKFQKREPEIAVPEHQKQMMRDTPWGRMTYLEYKKRIEFGREQYDYIDKYCCEKPIDWSASPWDVPSVRFLQKYNIPYIKIASATITNVELLKTACELEKPIIMSTGMSTWEEIDAAVDVLEKYAKGNYILMHTNSEYPTPYEDLNLNMINTLKKRYGCLVGYSGHEIDLEPTVLAVALGANVIERHVTLAHEMWGTDQKSSLTVRAMGLLKGRIHDMRKTMGSGEKVLSDGEKKVREKLRG